MRRGRAGRRSRAAAGRRTPGTASPVARPGSAGSAHTALLNWTRCPLVRSWVVGNGEGKSRALTGNWGGGNCGDPRGEGGGGSWGASCSLPPALQPVFPPKSMTSICGRLPAGTPLSLLPTRGLARAGEPSCGRSAPSWARSTVRAGGGWQRALLCPPEPPLIVFLLFCSGHPQPGHCGAGGQLRLRPFAVLLQPPNHHAGCLQLEPPAAPALSPPQLTVLRRGGEGRAKPLRSPRNRGTVSVVVGDPLPPMSRAAQLAPRQLFINKNSSVSLCPPGPAVPASLGVAASHGGGLALALPSDQCSHNELRG